MIDKNIPEVFTITERNKRKPGKQTPHSLQFPAMMSQLRTLLGLEQRVGTLEDGGQTWLTDKDYFFQIGVSTEGFGLKYGMEDLLLAEKWNNEPLKDCFLSEGIRYRLVADEDVKIKDGNLNRATVKEEVVAHLSTDLPVILLRKGNHFMPFKLAVGYADYGDTLMVHQGAGTILSVVKHAKAWDGWVNEICAVIFIDGIGTPIDRNNVILRSLSRAYEMLTETKETFSEYGYGKYMWDTWIARLDNDMNYKAKSNVLKYIVPEKFDLAERRCFAADFFTEAEEYLGENTLKEAIQSFKKIHNYMWDIHWLVTGKMEGNLLKRETRDQIIDILNMCRSLDLKAAENIKQVLDGYSQPKPDKKVSDNNKLSKPDEQVSDNNKLSKPDEQVLDSNELSKPDRFDNRVNVIGINGQSQNPTYLRRAKGLVKNERAEWVDEKTIRMVEPCGIDEADEIVAEYKYHCQHQAESFARAILPVPVDYPLRKGLSEDFRVHFSRLCELAKDIYMDMAIQPEAYGLMLVDIESTDHNLARDGYRSIHRFVDTLSNLSRCGKLENHKLTVFTEDFRKSIKKGTGLVSGPIPKYELMFMRMVDFGFVFSGFEGKPFSKKVEDFSVEYPDYPEMIDTIKTYCDCLDLLRTDHSTVKIWAGEFHHHFYRFDYKVTADHDALTMLQWVKDEADYSGYSPEQKAFSIAFYEYSLQYKKVKFNGDYIYQSKRIARIWQSEYSALGKLNYLLSLKLKNMDRYMSEIKELPESLKKPLESDYCQFCNFQGATEEHCKFRIRWAYEDKPHVGCAHICFNYDDFNVAHVPDYWRLLELEYGLKKE